VSVWVFAFACLVSFYLSGMEAAVTALSRLRLRRWLREGRSGARTLLQYLDRPENFLWTILVGNTLANLAVIWLLAAWLGRMFPRSPGMFWFAFFAFALALYLLCELLPKRLFRIFPNRLAMRFLPPFRVIHFLVSPLVAAVEWFTNLLLRVAGGRSFGARIFADREELQAFMAEGASELNPTERALIGRVMDMQRRTVGGLARPLEAAQILAPDCPVDQILRLSRETGHMRFPVWAPETAAGRRIAGVASVKGLLYGEPAARPHVASECLRPAMYIDENVRLDDALSRMQRAGEHLAIVVDEARRERGLVTLGDLLGAIFGASRP
jgi:putative hemolysin